MRGDEGGSVSSFRRRRLRYKQPGISADQKVCSTQLRGDQSVFVVFRSCWPTYVVYSPRGPGVDRGKSCAAATATVAI